MPKKAHKFERSHEGMAPQIYEFFQKAIIGSPVDVQIELLEAVNGRAWTELTEGAKQIFRDITYRVVMELEADVAGR